MSPATIIILAAVLLLAGLAIWRTVRKGSCGACNQCGQNCPGCKQSRQNH